MENIGLSFFEPTCPFCMVGSYAPLSVCLYGLDQNQTVLTVFRSILTKNLVSAYCRVPPLQALLVFSGTRTVVEGLDAWSSHNANTDH